MGKSSRDAFLKIIEAEPILRATTLNTARGFALWFGANEAVRLENCSFNAAMKLASDYRDDHALMTAIRLYALFERKKEISFQAVNCSLKREDVVALLVEHAIGHNSHAADHATDVCLAGVSKFKNAYSLLNWESHRGLMNIRNVSLAHLSSEEIKKHITYDELDNMVRIAIKLSDALNQVVNRTITDSLVQYEGGSSIARMRWQSLVRRREHQA